MNGLEATLVCWMIGSYVSKNRSEDVLYIQEKNAIM